MQISIGVIGCGNQFRNVYLKVLKHLLYTNKINSLKIYSRNIHKIIDIKNEIKCDITTDLNELLNDKNINFLILSVPLSIRSKILLKKNLKDKIILSEPPIANNLGEFFKISRTILQKNILFEVFEDRFYFNYNLENKSQVKLFINNNSQWMHHSIAQLFKVNSNFGDIKKITYNLINKEYDIFKFNFKNLIYLYKFSKIKSSANRENGFIKIVNFKNKMLLQNNPNISDKYTNKQLALHKCLMKLININVTKKKLYFYQYSEMEILLTTLMKIMKKYRIKSINSLGIKFFKLFFYLVSFIKY